MIPDAEKHVPKNPESHFKAYLETFTKQGFLTGHLIVTRKGTLEQTNFLVCL